MGCGDASGQFLMLRHRCARHSDTANFEWYLPTEAIIGITDSRPVFFLLV
jgi:hypothetical protein